MLGLSANLNYYLFNGNVDLRKGIFRLCESINAAFMCFMRNVLLWESSRSRCLMKSPDATGYSGLIWLTLRKAS